MPEFVRFCMLTGIGLLLLLAVLIKYFVVYYADIRRLRAEIRTTFEWHRFVRCKRELRTLYLSVLPGLSPARVKAIRGFFYRGKYVKPEEREDSGLSAMLMPSVLCTCICCICLVGGTFCWFTASQSTEGAKILSATYDSSLTVTDSNGEVAPTSKINCQRCKGDCVGHYDFVSGTGITVTASAEETNTGSGYVKVVYGEGVDDYFVSRQIQAGETLTFTLSCDKPVSIQILWGVSNRCNNPDIRFGNVYEITFEDGEAELKRIPSATE